MQNSSPLQTVFYSIEKAIKEYRKYAQVSILKHISDITLDQTLVLMILNETPQITQKDIANLLYKDNASLTRIIELMVKKGYLTRKKNHTDGRRSQLDITEKGKATIKKLSPVIIQNRSTALEGLSEDEISQLDSLLNKITSNCTK
tara:strand:+ start:52423 stop:52860 length:438 start_codon:yes stop_codon:yes gene_type:complete